MRKFFIENFDKQTQKCMSVPLLTFIDRFGLYRNMYRSLMGMYFNLAALSFHEQTRRANVLPFTLGPHGSNFSDVIEAVQPLLSSLDKGQILEVNGEEAFICAFTLCYVGDMPQQQGNSGFMSQ